jgi:hypothetical protein
MTSETINTTNDAGVPPAPPEAHQRAENILDFLDEVSTSVNALRGIESLLIAADDNTEAIQPKYLASLLDVVIQRLEGAGEIARRDA